MRGRKYYPIRQFPATVSVCLGKCYTSYLLHQALQGQDPIHLEACFESELPSGAEVGLLLFQDVVNGEIQTPWVKVVRTELGARVTAEDTDGSTYVAYGLLNDPLCFRISRNGNTVYVYESVEAPNTQSLRTTAQGSPDNLITTLELNFDGNSQPQGGLITTSEEQTQSPIVVTAKPTIVGEPPTGSVIANVSVSTDFGEAPLTVDFDASASEGGNLTYEWDFGDGTSATGVTTSRTYTAEGDYTAVLTVTDDAGTNQQAEVEIIVVESPPTPQAEAVISNSGAIVNFTSDVVEFSAYGSQGAYPLQYRWNFGDGTSYTSDEPVAEHNYANPGDYTVELTVIDGSGNTSTTKFMTTVLPLVNSIPSIRSDIGQLDVTFDTMSSNPNLDFRWEFGDGNSTTGPVVSHQYEDLGTYLVDLQVMDLRVDPPKLVLEDKTTVTMWDKKPTAYFEADMYDRLENINFLSDTQNYYHYTISGRAPFVIKLDASDTQGEGELSYQYGLLGHGSII